MMPQFMTLEKFAEAIPGVNLTPPLPAGYTTTVSEDEAVILRTLPRLFTELHWSNEDRAWSPTAQHNTMVTGAAVTKVADEPVADEA